MDYMFILKEYGWIVLAVVFAALYFYWVYRKRGEAALKVELRERVYKLMLLAEKQFGDGSGILKLQWVVDRFYPALPNTVKFIVTKEDAIQFVQKIYWEIKDYMDDGAFNDSYIQKLRE